MKKRNGSQKRDERGKAFLSQTHAMLQNSSSAVEFESMRSKRRDIRKRGGGGR